jgi:hypothetical protein
MGADERDEADDTDESGNRRREHKAFPGQDRRGRGPRKSIGRFLGIICSVVGIATGSIALRSCVPETTAAADQAHDGLTKRIDGVVLHDQTQDKQLSELSLRLDSIDRTGERNVNLSLRSALRSIEDDLRKVGTAGAGRANLERQRDQACQDLSDSNVKLNYPRERCAP